MKKRMIIGLFLFLTCLFLGYKITANILSAFKNKNNIAQIEDEIIAKLIDIRKAQKAYLSIHQRYTADWDSLKHFIEHGQFAITKKKEIALNSNSSFITSDTLGFVSVKDSLYKNRKINLTNFEKVPGTEKTFSIFAYNNEGEHFIEVKDPDSVNPNRKKGKKPNPLKFGNTKNASTKGSWEK